MNENTDESCKSMCWISSFAACMNGTSGIFDTPFTKVMLFFTNKDFAADNTVIKDMAPITLLFGLMRLW